MLTDQAILRQIERQPHRSAGFKQLIREMGLRGAERQQLAERLHSLVKSGRLTEPGATVTPWRSTPPRVRTLSPGA